MKKFSMIFKFNIFSEELFNDNDVDETALAEDDQEDAPVDSTEMKKEDDESLESVDDDESEVNDPKHRCKARRCGRCARLVCLAFTYN